MLDPKAAFTEALRAALDGYEDIFAAYQNAESISDALLDLPDVAVVGLPEPDHVDPGDEFENGRTDYALGDVSVFEDGEIHLFGAVSWPSELRALAGGLLAAVALSERIVGD